MKGQDEKVVLLRKLERLEQSATQSAPSSARCTHCGGSFDDIDAHMRDRHPTKAQKSEHKTTEQLQELVVSSLQNTMDQKATIVPCLFGSGAARIDTLDQVHLLPSSWGNVKLQQVMQMALKEGIIPEGSRLLASIDDPSNIVSGKRAVHTRYDTHHVTVDRHGMIQRGFRWDDGKDAEVKNYIGQSIDLDTINSVRTPNLHVPNWIFHVYERYHYLPEKQAVDNKNSKQPVRCPECGDGYLSHSPRCPFCKLRYHKKKCANHPSNCPAGAVNCIP